MLKKIKSIVFVSLLCLMFIPDMSYAEEDIVVPDFIQGKNEFTVKDIDESIPYSDVKIDNDDITPKLNESLSFYSTGILNKNLNRTNDSGDAYEPNDSSNSAYPISFNNTIKANLNTEADQDWYKFDITSYDIEKCPGGIFTVILKNIPAGKDYDMYLFKRQPDGGMGYTPIDKLPNSVASYFNISEGSYMIAVFAKDSIPNNFSDQNYELYVGNAFIPRSTGYMDTNLKFDFGFNKYPMPFLSKAQYFDLSNDYTIPNNSLIKEVNLTSDGNNAHWLGLTKVFDGYKASMALDYIHLPQYQIPVKENHAIQAYITRSDGFVWKPRVQINYVYPLIEENYRFYFGR